MACTQIELIWLHDNTTEAAAEAQGFEWRDYV